MKEFFQMLDLPQILKLQEGGSQTIKVSILLLVLVVLVLVLVVLVLVVGHNMDYKKTCIYATQSSI